VKIRDLLIEYAHEEGYIECQGSVMPPEHYSLKTHRNTIIFMKQDRESGLPLFSDTQLRMFTLIENGMKYIGTNGGITEMDIRDPDSLEKFKEILEHGDGKTK